MRLAHASTQFAVGRLSLLCIGTGRVAMGFAKQAMCLKLTYRASDDILSAREQRTQQQPI